MLFVSALFAMQPARGEINDVPNNTDFSAFYREWEVSPSNALEQITPPLMAFAASAKTSFASGDAIRDALKNLFSTNMLVKTDMKLLDKKCDLIVNVFKEFGTFATPQEEIVLPFAISLGFIRSLFVPGEAFPMECIETNANHGNVFLTSGPAPSKTSQIESSNSSASSKILPILKIPHYSDNEAMAHYENYKFLREELGHAEDKLFFALANKTMKTAMPPQERHKIFAKIVSSQALRLDEENAFSTALNRRWKGIFKEQTPPSKTD
jgi:hypothetical protein